MILTLNVKCFVYTEDDSECRRVIEIDENATLEELHLIIQESVNFYNDHLYEFFIANTPRSQAKFRFDDENEQIYTCKVGDLYPLEKGKKLFYLFDYGDSWLFQISKTRKKPSEPMGKINYPRIIEKIGQDPEQYPDYDDE